MDYKRLTNEELNEFLSRVFIQLEPEVTQQMMSVANELLQYRDKIEQGTIVELPCKVGDTVYTVEYANYYDRWFIEEHKIAEMLIGKDDIYFMNEYGCCVYNAFLTKAEAEAKLRELQGAER